MFKSKKQKKLEEVRDLFSVFSGKQDPKSNRVKQGLIGVGVVTGLAAVAATRKKADQ